MAQASSCQGSWYYLEVFPTLEYTKNSGQSRGKRSVQLLHSYVESQKIQGLKPLLLPDTEGVPGPLQTQKSMRVVCIFEGKISHYYTSSAEGNSTDVFFQQVFIEHCQVRGIHWWEAQCCPYFPALTQTSRASPCSADIWASLTKEQQGWPF